MPRTAWWTIVACTLILSTGACGDADEGPVVTIPGATSGAATAAPDMCDLVTPEQIAAVLGTPVTAAPVQQTCEFRGIESDAPAVGIGSALVADLGGSIETLAQRVEASTVADATRTDPGLGEESFVLVGRAPDGAGLRGFAAARASDGVVVTVTLLPDATDPAAVARQLTDVLAAGYGAIAP